MEKSSSTGDDAVRAAARAVTQGDITELSAFAAPPQAVKAMMEAVQLLLGQPVHVATDFGRAKRLLKATRKEGLLQQISERNIDLVAMDAARRAKQSLGPYSAEQMKNVSMAGVSLFNWVTAVIEAVERRGE
ncbi:hypothetical protein EGW08_013393 [Elysia chlorotica]|uniref:Uncharacterized protein n=1 Tax=Elysia chlorotica TaxID=188477 RepID=A0A433TB90_ELYCH|nr:hypothetical protein EGW08_013393 [Elysia chlorotica]